MRSSFRSWLSTLLVLLTGGVVLWFSGCGGHSGNVDPWNGTPKKRILTTIAPLYCFAAEIAGEDAGKDAEVLCLLANKGPHDFEASPNDAKILSGADLFLANGLTLEGAFVNTLIRGSGNRHLRLVYVAEALPKDRLIEASGAPHYHGDKLVTHSGTDPHVWLGLPEAKLMVNKICEEICRLDAPHEQAYKARAEALQKKLDVLLAERNKIIVTGKIVTFHDSFRYFARGSSPESTFEVSSIKGLRGEELSAGDLREQADQFRKEGVKAIGVEPQYPRAVAENLAKAIGPGVKIIELDPIETAPLLDGASHKLDRDWYFKQMQRNLTNLRRAFGS